MEHANIRFLVVLLHCAFLAKCAFGNISDAEPVTFLEEISHQHLSSLYRLGIHHRIRRVPPIDMTPYYDGCGKTKGCIPTNCIESRNCDYLVTWTYNEDTGYVRFEVIAAKVKSSDENACPQLKRSYLAVGFSANDHDDMESLLVVQCGKHQNSQSRMSGGDDETAGQSTGVKSGSKTKTNVLDEEDEPAQTLPSASSKQNGTQGDEADAAEGASLRRKKDASSSKLDIGGKHRDEADEDQEGRDLDHDNFDDDQAVHDKLKKSKKAKQTKKERPHPDGKHILDTGKGATARMGRNSPNPGDSLVHLGWSSQTEYELYGDGCDGTTTSGKIRDCGLTMDDQNNLVCSFDLQQRIVARLEIFNFLDTPHYISVVSGCDTKELNESFSQGSKLFRSKNAVHLHTYNQNTALRYSSELTRWHGTVMTVAWCVLVPNGMFFSRYFKESFVQRSCCKYRIWFAGHLLTQLMALLCCIVAVVLIIKERLKVGFQWPTSYNAMIHLRLSLFVLFFLAHQVFFGGIRCSGKKVRRVFACIHFLIGLTCYILAITTIGLSGNVGMTCGVEYFVVGMVVWKIICHIMMMIHFHRLDTKLGLKISRALYPFPIAPVTYDELNGSGVRMQILILHFLGSLTISGTLIFRYWTTEPCNEMDLN